MANAMRKYAADKIATLEYKWILLVIIVTVAWANYYFLVIEAYKGLVGTLVSLSFGWVAAYFAKILYFSRRLLKQYSEQELREKWLAMGGFPPDAEND